jgi:NADH-quinone oxidoreductase subunit E
VVIDASIREAIVKENARFPVPRGGLLAALRLVQEAYGAVNPTAADELAEIFELRRVEILEVMSFYDFFTTAPVGRHRVHVCTGLSCSLLGGRTLLREIARQLEVEPGATTRDGRITLARGECLGACANAPVMRIDGEYHEDLDPAGAERALAELE